MEFLSPFNNLSFKLKDNDFAICKFGENVKSSKILFITNDKLLLDEIENLFRLNDCVDASTQYYNVVDESLNIVPEKYNIVYIAFTKHTKDQTAFLRKVFSKNTKMINIPFKNLMPEIVNSVDEFYFNTSNNFRDEAKRFVNYALGDCKQVDILSDSIY